MKNEIPRWIKTNDGLRIGIRRMTSEDLPSWVDLMRQSNDYFAFRWNLPRARLTLGRSLDSPNSCYVVGTYNNQVIAYYGLSLPLGPQSEIAYTEGAVVRADFRGKRITHALMDILENYVRSKDRRFVVTRGVMESNIAPQRILRSRGYNLVGRRRGVVFSGGKYHDLLVFMKRLSQENRVISRN